MRMVIRVLPGSGGSTGPCLALLQSSFLLIEEAFSRMRGAPLGSVDDSHCLAAPRVHDEQHPTERVAPIAIPRFSSPL
jgi:hypothetical protein